MNTKIKSVLAAASVLALSALTANAQLLLNSITQTFLNPTSGTITNQNVAFTSPTSATTTVTGIGGNGVVTITANPRPSLPLNLTLGSPFVITSLFIDQTQSPAALAEFDFKLALDFGPTVGLDLTNTFHISLKSGTAAPGGAGNAVQTYFEISPVTSAGLFTNNGTTYGYQFIVANTNGVLDASPTDPSTGTPIIRLTVTAVPEPSTYALFGVVALLGMVAVRRFRSTKSTVA